MEKEFIPYQPSLDLKELGFDEPCFATYRTHAVGSKKPFEYDLDYHTKVEMSSNVIPINSEYTEESKWISAPLYQQAFEFFRKKYGLHGKVGIYHFFENTYCYNIVSKNAPHYIHKESQFKTYEEAELKCLKKLIEIVKTQKL